MFKKAPLFVALIFLFSCAPFIKTADLNSIKPGIGRAEFVKVYGQPHGTDYQDGYYYLSYFVGKDALDDFQKYYFAFDKNDRLVGWKSQRDNSVRGMGMVLSFPVNPLGK